MEKNTEATEQVEIADGHQYERESKYAQYIPGGYSPSRCLKLTGRPMLYAILALSGTAIMFFGYDASVMSQVNTNPDYLAKMGTNHGTSRDSAAIGGIVSVWFGGFAIGALMVGSYADRIGRLKTMQLGCMWALLGAVLQASAQNITWMCFARVIGGIGCGHLNTVVPIWTSELGDATMRGAFVAVQFTLALAGSTLAFWMEYGCVKHMGPVAAWRFPVAFQILFILMIQIATPFYPESPRHLAQTGRLEEARDILTRCRVDPDPIKVDLEMRGIEDAIRMEAQSNHTYYSMLFTKDKFHTQRRILLGAGVQIMQKLTGIDFIATYAPQMFSLAGYKGDKPVLLAGGNFFGYTASLTVAIYLADRFGRRKLMLTGSLSMGIVLIVGGVLARQVLANTKTDPGKANALGGGVAAVLYVYTFLYGSCWLTTCWVYPTEVFPLSSRARGTALATVAFSLAGGTINEIVPYLITAVGFWVFILFALLNFAMLVPIYLFYLETANRNLEDFDMLFSTKSKLVWRAEAEFAQAKAERAMEKA